MTPRFSCTLNGVDPASISPAIRITDVTELPPRRRVVTVPTLRHGLRLLRRVRESLTVRLHFMILEQDPAARRELLSRLHAWAEPGGVLTTSDRPGQQLTVVCDTLPMLSALCWSDELTLEFTAMEVPFWETTAVTRVTTDAGADLTLPGSAEDCPVTALVVNQGDAPLTTLTLRCGDTRVTFDGLAVPPGSALTASSDGGLFRASVDGESVLLSRTADSSDLLLAPGGQATPVSVAADQPVTAEFSGKGWFL